MYKGCRWILILLITSELTIHASCLEFINKWDPIRQRNSYISNPSRNEYRPIQLANPRVNERHSIRNLVPPVNRNPSARAAYGYASVTREVYAHPLKPVTKSEATGLESSPTRIVTKSPTSFDISLRKSIRVSNNRVPIPMAGYLRTTKSPKHTVFVDGNLKQASAQPDQDMALFGDSWRPKRLPTVVPTYKTSVLRPEKPIPFTRFSDAMAAIEHRNKERGNPSLKLAIHTPRVNSGESSNARMNSRIETKDKVEASTNAGSSSNLNLQGQHTAKTVLKSNNVRGGFKKINPSVLRNLHVDKTKSTTSDDVKLGVEYAGPEHDDHVQVNTHQDQTITINKDSIVDNKDSIDEIINVGSSDIGKGRPYQNIGNEENFNEDDIKTDHNSSESDESRYSDTSKIIDDNHKYILNSKNLAKHKESTSHNRQDSDNVQMLTNKSLIADPKKLESYVRYDGETSNIDNTSDKDSMSGYANEKRIKIENNTNKKSDFQVPSKVNQLDLSGIQIPSVFDKDTAKESGNPMSENFPQAPFYGEIIHQPYNKDSSKEITEDRIYFPQIFPETRKNFENHRNVTDSITTKHATVHITKNNYVDKERLIEINPKEHGKKKFDDQHQTYFNQVPVSSFKSPQPTSPSLVTVSSESSNHRRPADVVLDPKRTKDRTNKTSNYVLHRNPVLSAGIPGYDRPRKPNVRLTPGMLAGILIAALIFLGFLTGTMVFVFHQFKFSSRPKKTERLKKRTTIYAPEYLDENFSGNTYIHNNIFLPNPQNLEDRLSPDLDTSFSIDSEETAQVNDRHYPSTSTANTRVKTMMQQRTHGRDIGE